MENMQNEILKRKKVRKTLLLKINSEIEQISESKPTLMINSQTIQDIEKKYNKNNILLLEKSIIYSNYVKTETKIFPQILHPVHRIKSVEKTLEKSKIKTDIVGPSYEEDIVSPILNFFPKKIDLASKKLTVADKRYTKNIEIKQKLIEDNLNTEKEDQLNKSTKIENNNLHKLIDKILLIKNNENMEKIIIKKNIKKLRKYCYKFRKKKKKNKGRKSRERKTNLHITASKHLIFKINEKEKDKERKMSNFCTVPHASSKKQKNFLSVKHKRKIIKLKTLVEDNDKNYIIQLHKVKVSKPVRTSDYNKTNNNTNDNTITTIHSSNKNNNKIIIYNDENNNSTNKKNNFIINIHNENDEEVPSLNAIKKELMRSSVNKKPSKYDIGKIEKNKNRNSKKINKKKIFLNKNTSLFIGKEIERLNFSLKREKKDKIELHDNLLNKNNKKTKKVETNKSEEKTCVKIKKLNISKKKKSHKKLIESPLNKNDYYSNCNTYYYTNIFTLTQSTNEKNNNKLNSRKRNSKA